MSSDSTNLDWKEYCARHGKDHETPVATATATATPVATATTAAAVSAVPTGAASTPSVGELEAWDIKFMESVGTDGRLYALLRTAQHNGPESLVRLCARHLVRHFLPPTASPVPHWIHPPPSSSSNSASLTPSTPTSSSACAAPILASTCKKAKP
jgi:hypothetical protein